jgi:hypothetical protein
MPLTTQQIEWARRYSRSRSTVDAGKPLGVSPTQGRAWLADPEVAQEIADAQDERAAAHPQPEDIIEEWHALSRVDLLRDFVIEGGVVMLSEHASAAAGRCVRKLKIKANGDVEIELRDRDEMLRHLAEWRGIATVQQPGMRQGQPFETTLVVSSADPRVVSPDELREASGQSAIQVNRFEIPKEPQRDGNPPQVDGK